MTPNREEHERHAALGIGSGFRAFAGGIGFILGTPAVWPWALVPMTMMLFLSCVLGLAGVWGAARTTTALFGSDGGNIFSWFTILILVVPALLVAVLLALGLAQPFSGFALEAIVRAQERALTGRATEPPPFFNAFWVSIKIVTMTLIAGGFLLTILLLISFLFPPAAVVTVPLKFLLCGWLLAWDFLDYPLSLRGLGLRARWHWVRRNFDAFTVFGVAWTCLVIVPGIILILLPMGVAGATRLVVEEEGS
jgi:uncharacterized protein involved in cysteine biosynthesis